MNCCEGTGSRALLLVGGGRVSFWFGKDSALGDEDDIFVRELLFEFSGEPSEASTSAPSSSNGSSLSPYRLSECIHLERAARWTAPLCQPNRLPRLTFECNTETAHSPLLDFVEGLDHGHRHKDDDSLLSPLDVDLFRCANLQLTELGL